MPEGDIVRRTATALHLALSGQQLVASDFRVPALATVDLTGWLVESTTCYGKHLFTKVRNGASPLVIHTHLRMTGSWHLYAPGAKRRGGPDYEIRLRLLTPTREAVGYRIPVIELIDLTQQAAVISRLGPDLLSEDFDHDEAVRRLNAEPDRQIGDALLDQRVVAGLGTVFRSETLFVNRTHPFRTVAQSPVAELVSTGQRQLRRAVAAGNQVTTGDNRRGHEHFVYGRAGRTCRRCDALIVQATTGQPPFDRVVFWCPTCQPE